MSKFVYLNLVKFLTFLPYGTKIKIICKSRPVDWAIYQQGIYSIYNFIESAPGSKNWLRSVSLAAMNNDYVKKFKYEVLS